MRISDWSSDVCSSDLFASLYSGRAPVDAGAAATGAAGVATASVSSETAPNSLRNRITKQPLPFFAAASSFLLAASQLIALTLLRQKRPVHRKRVCKGKSASVCVDIGGSQIFKHKKKIQKYTQI